MHTEIIIILDRSGSMESVRGDTIGGFNSFLSEQQKLPDPANMTLVQFDNVYEVVFEALPLADVKPLGVTTFVPRGSTALLDAIGKTINVQGARFGKMAKGDQPRRVVVAILTDGEENSSHEFNRDMVFRLISEQRDKWGWHFYFLGANQDAIREAAGIGIRSGQAILYAANAAGVAAANVVLGKAVATSRSSRSDDAYSMTDEDRTSTSRKTN